MPANPGTTLPPPPMNLKVDPAFYRWLQTIYNLFSGNGGINMSFVDQSQILLSNLGEKSHQSLTSILPVDASSTDGTLNKHVSNGTINTINSSLNSISGAAIAAQTTANQALNTANNNTTSIGTINGQISTINGQISSINSQISTINGQISALQARNQVLNGTAPPATALGNDGDWYADYFNKHIYVKQGLWQQVV